MRPSYTALLIMTLIAGGCGGSAAIEPAKQPSAEHVSAPAPSTPVGPVDGVACVGTVAALPEGVKEVSDDSLARSAIDESGKGKLCMARIFEVVAPMKVYRVWNSAKSYTEFGQWWSFAKPVGPVETYREQNAVCPEWSALDRVTVCELKVGARFAIGPGQSAKCTSTQYEKSAVNQLFIPNDTREDKLFVDHCEQLGAFP